jgi:cation diffusion facilitator CzcD-associated flavoprotein CzcO
MSYPDTPALRALTRQVQDDLALMAYPKRNWVLPPVSLEPEHTPGAATGAATGAAPGAALASDHEVHDVLIIGAGQAGLATALALRRDGVDRVLLVDSQPAGHEGVWENFARMTHLRTPKATVGIEGGLPNLSAPAFYKAAYGSAAWESIERIERPRWMAFLRWFRHAAGLEVLNEQVCTSLKPQGDLIAVQLARSPGAQAHAAPQSSRTVLARHVVLATGFDGCGAWRVPAHIARAIAPERLNHTNGPIDFAALAGKRVGILGHGASAFDNACQVLAHGAASVDLCFRRTQIPTVNPHRRLEFAGFLKHFYDLDDLTRWHTNQFFELHDQPPTQNGWDQAHSYPQFHVHSGSPWLEVHDDGQAVQVRTPHADFSFDHVICATGAVVDYNARAELRTLGPLVRRWRHAFTPPEGLHSETLGEYPYLGPGFEYQPLDPVRDGWVRRVKAFNFSSIVSMGPHTTSASGHKHAVPRLVSGITGALMAEQAADLIPALQAYTEPELRPWQPVTQMAKAA